MLRKYAAVAALAIALTPAAALAVPTYSVQVLEGMEGYETRTTALNDSGQVVGAVIPDDDPNLPVRSILWNDGSLVDLAGSDHLLHVAGDINNSGQIIGGYRDTGDLPFFKAYFWNGSLNDITPSEDDIPGWLPYSVNNNGQVVLAIPGFSNQIHLWSQGDGHTSIDIPESMPAIYPTDINDAGQIVGWFKNQDNEIQAFFRDTDGTFHEIPITGLGFFLGTLEINENGLVSGTIGDEFISPDFISTSFNWTLEDGLTILDGGSFESTTAYDNNNNGQVVGEVNNLAETGYGAIWEDEELFLLDNLVSLDDPLFGLLSITRASGVNNLGQIAAEGILLETGEQIGLLLTPNGIYIAPVPAPGALGLLICGAGLLLYRRRKQI